MICLRRTISVLIAIPCLLIGIVCWLVGLIFTLAGVIIKKIGSCFLGVFSLGVICVIGFSIHELLSPHTTDDMHAIFSTIGISLVIMLAVIFTVILAGSVSIVLVKLSGEIIRLPKKFWY
ncbi:hypothetical protein I588_05244 [Enterococcus pallens ATCC BAA-351]|uniref:Uncharacterized protein n=1 Tax=Enterococcus pallens ATCC BAA-351 TaxID=1158607 RepID=R2PSJ0_9ENTE|nr:hypothetical protein UAU_05299 [Enterococcus pallens ATCC BAA-351]EOU09398.1 hypothetical protein I588_05244 [Enterococcus pallens ATCC BAA-351]